MESSIAVFLSRRSACERPPTSATARACCSTRCCCQNARARRAPALRPSPAEALGASYFGFKASSAFCRTSGILARPVILLVALLGGWMGSWLRGLAIAIGAFLEPTSP